MNESERRTAMECTIVDVFAERPLAGNQLAVVRGCSHLDSAEMQAIAREMNFSETTFVIEERDGEAKVRIFTPDRELPFAGHPTLGTAWVLGRDRGGYTLDVAAGRVPVTFEADGIVWMEPPPVDLGESLDPRRAAALLGLNEFDLDDRFPSRFATVGPWFALIGLQTLDALRCITVDPVVYEEVSAGGWLALFAFADEALQRRCGLRRPHADSVRWVARRPGDGEREHGIRRAPPLARNHRELRRGAGLRDRPPIPPLSRRRPPDPCRRQGPPGADRHLRPLTHLSRGITPLMPTTPW